MNILIIAAFIDGLSQENITPSSTEATVERIKSRVPFNSFDIIIAVDGGVYLAEKLGISPRVVVGDFDSSREYHMTNVEKIIKLPVEKDITDLQAALEYAVNLGDSHITVLGGINGRLDQTVANIEHLATYSEKSQSLCFLDGDNYMSMQRPSKKSYSKSLGRHFSIFSYSEKSEGITLEGAYYPLHDASLTRSFPLGVSNSFVFDEITLTFSKGTVLIIISDVR